MLPLYRPNVAILVTDGQGRVLLCYRHEKEVESRVQTVQGGIDPGETPLEAAKREIAEEIGLRPDQYKIVAEAPTKYRYDWPSVFIDQLEHKTYIGQEQQFFLIQVDPEIVFQLDTHEQEFSEVRWGSPQELVDLAWEKKRPGLAGALKEFGLLAADTQPAVDQAKAI
jgi:putative (di)nucleoside polyphosphate hydrolase